MINTDHQYKGCHKSEQELVQHGFTGPYYIKYYYHNDRLVQYIEWIYSFIDIILNAVFLVQVSFSVSNGREDPAPGCNRK